MEKSICYICYLAHSLVPDFKQDPEQKSMLGTINGIGIKNNNKKAPCTFCCRCLLYLSNFYSIFKNDVSKSANMAMDAVILCLALCVLGVMT